MKKIISVLILLLTFTLVGCSSDNQNPFNLVNHNDNYYIYRKINAVGISYTTIRDDFIEGKISYYIFKNPQDLGRKVYWDSRLSTEYKYEYYPENGYWIRTIGEDHSSNNGVDLWDIDNYTLDGYVYKLKDSIDAGDTYFCEVWYSEGKVHRTLKSYARAGGYTYNMTWTEVYSKFGEEFNLTLPTIYQNG